MGELLAGALRASLGIEAPFLHGGRSRKQRDDLVTAFQSERGPRALIVSLKAGGTGLNLTAASQVIHYDLWWNPAVEAEATDRAYRIGQRRNVSVHRLITENTLWPAASSGSRSCPMPSCGRWSVCKVTRRICQMISTPASGACRSPRRRPQPRVATQ
jgi:hypothetical protein